jgi:thiol-disulfide isomerase/thioredoxin
MLGGIRTILFQTELEYPPIEDIRITDDQVRELYNKMCEPGSGHRYENLDLQGTVRVLSTRRPPGGHSRVEFEGSKIRIEEKNPETTLDGFVTIATTVLRRMGEWMPKCFIQRCKIQCLAQPANAENAVVFLANNVANVYEPEKVMVFERPPSFFGVRFRFVPFQLIRERTAKRMEEAINGTKEIPPEEREKTKAEIMDQINAIQGEGFVTVRFESHAADVSQVWMEASATHLCEAAVTPANLDIVGKNVTGTYQFLTDKCKRFLDLFDEPSKN